ncbi:Hypothetical predicted protein [Mytilus galloprovincialis]|uniref:Mab-21-like HhH/H2TH-like domain-containing protein n=1 Tax=Mytilus galloprovincialis TaxID=29158 RepID=A0A8B6C1F9_MYTGA|nr:Hypothetical predicted protein [Mytilus galloprovincialis]
MFVDEVVNVTQIERNIKHPVQRTEVFMETDTDYPGFTRLRLIAAGERANPYVSNESILYTQTGLYLSTTNFVNFIKQFYNIRQNVLTHGPCLSDQNQTVDIAFCLRSKYLPYHAMPWKLRYRRQWPPNAIIDRIINYGCLLVPIGPRIMANCNLLWRISFSVAEKQLVHSFNFTQVLCYGLLKLTLKRIVNTNDDVKDLLCSYFVKTALFWVSEEVDIDTFQLPKLFICFDLCLNKLIAWRDAVTGWLLYASFYYVTEQYNVTLRLTEYILSMNLLDMVRLGQVTTVKQIVDNYRRNVHSSMTLNAKMKKAVVDNVIFLQHSSLIPQELELEVEDTFFRIPPIIMSHCLRFLCYHHIGDTFNRQQALRHLRSPHVVNTSVVSNTFTLVGVCCEISGNKDVAFQCYEDALQCDDWICSSAEKRKSRLLNI